MSSDLLISENGPIATIAFNRAGTRNSISPAMLDELETAVAGFALRAELRVIVLRGAEELPFSSGYDMRELSGQKQSLEDAKAIHAPVRAAAEALWRAPQIVVGAARKFVFGAGLDVFLHCDIRICSDDTRFCMPPNRHGFLYPAQGMQRLAAMAGLSRASWMILTGNPISADAALASGLVQQKYETAQFESELGALIHTLSHNAPLSMRETKRTLNAIGACGTGEDDESMYDRIAMCLNSDDVREAMAAFKEKRPPVFCGR